MLVKVRTEHSDASDAALNGFARIKKEATDLWLQTANNRQVSGSKTAKVPAKRQSCLYFEPKKADDTDFRATPSLSCPSDIANIIIAQMMMVMMMKGDNDER